MTVVRLSRTFPREEAPGAGLHAYYYTKHVLADTLIITKHSPSPICDKPDNATIVEVAYRDMSFRRRREALRYLLIALSKVYGDLRFMFGAISHIRSRRKAVTLVHLHSHVYILTALVLKYVYRVPLVVGFHGTDLLRVQGNPLLRTLLGRADVMLHVSSAMSPVLRKLFPSATIVHIGNFVDLDYFVPSECPRAPVFLAVGNLRWQKDYETLIRAFARVSSRASGFRLVILGEGPDRGVIEHLVGQLGISSKVHLFGMADRAEVRRRFRDSTALVLSSVSEGFPKVLIEAMACGTPVIATDVGDCRHVVGHAGTIVPPRSPEALADALLRMIEDRQFYDGLRSRCRGQAERYGLQQLITRVAGAYGRTTGNAVEWQTTWSS